MNQGQIRSPNDEALPVIQTGNDRKYSQSK